MNWKTKVFIGIGALVAFIACILFFALTDSQTSSQWIGLFVLLFSICIIISFIILLRFLTKRLQSKIVFGGVLFAIILYAVVSLVISIIFMSGLINSLAVLLVSHVILLAFTGIAILLVISTAKWFSEKDSKILQAVSVVKQIQDSISLLMIDERNEMFSNQLNKIFEAIRYCDNATYTQSDDTIKEKIVELKAALNSDIEDRNNNVTKILNEILILTEARKLEAQKSKSGGL